MFLLRDPVMLDHIDFAVRDLEASRRFYSSTLAALDIEPFIDIKTDAGREGTGYGKLTGPQFWIGKGEAVKGRMHIAFVAKSRKAVDEFFEIALQVGGLSKGAPGVRPHYGEHYYAAFVIDPDGHTIEAVCRGAE
jgi:catechol 2,3-dioxygenase-like lactoylglutathione lyase family enzyme